MKYIYALLLIEEGVTIIEYAIIAALIAAVVVFILGLLGSELNVLYQEVVNSFPEL